MGDIGEKQFLRLLLPQLCQDDCFVNGFGHDSSIIDLGLERNIAFKIDRAPTPVSVRHGWSDYRVWGRLAAVANISDILATAAAPKGMMISITAPSSTDTSIIEEIVHGCAESCKAHGVTFLGGDTKQGDTINVVGACIGTVEKDYFLARRRADPGDHLVIAGWLGNFMGSYLLLRDEIRNPIDIRAELIKPLSHPIAQIGESTLITSMRSASSASDLSDGLYDVISTFCHDGLGVTIYEKDLPIHPHAKLASSRLNVDIVQLAFGVGDWAIAFVVPEKNLNSLLDSIDKGLLVTSIGRFNSTGEIAIERMNGKREPTPHILNEQFRSRLEDEASYLQSFLPNRQPSSN